MKRLLTIILIFTLGAWLLSGCTDSQEPSEEETIASESEGLYELLLSAFDPMTKLSEAENYLLHFAKENELRASYDEYHNVIISKPASPGYEDADAVVLQCTLALDDLPKRCRALSAALSVMTNAEEHGFLRLILTADDGSAMTGAKKISNQYLSADSLISLDFEKGNTLLVGGAGSAEYTMTKKIDWKTPSYEKAYALSITGLSGGNDTESAANLPNPVRVIGDLLATAKSNGILFELASFNGGVSADTLPQAAEAVVLLTQNDINKFTKRVTDSQEKFADHYAADNPEYTYTFTEVEMPDKVLSHDDCSNLISFLYTMIDGIFQQNNDGDIVASTNLGTISTHTGDLIVRTEALSMSREILEEITLVFGTICGLSDFSYEYTETFPVWEADEETQPLIEQLQAASKEALGKAAKNTTTLAPTVCAVLKDRNDRLNVVAYGVDEESFVQEIETLLTYLRNLKPATEDESGSDA